MHGAVRAGADDPAFTLRLARYCARHPVALGRMEYDEQAGAVTYHSDKPTGPTAGSETTDALEFLARVTSHIPNKGQVLQRYYGWYSSRQRGMRRWAELLRRLFEVDPLACPRCGAEMRIVAFMTEPTTIDRILDHLRRPHASRQRQRAPPRRWQSPARTASA